MARTTYDVWDKTVQALLSDAVDASERQALFADFAREQLRDAEAINTRALGRTPTHDTFVDGIKGASENSVKPVGGRIIYEFNLLDDVIAWIGEELVRLSPVGLESDKREGHPGFYREHHGFYADRTKVEMGAVLPPAQEYAFVALAPYARKIERGLSDQAPEGVYEVVADMAKERFGSIVAIRFTFRSLYSDQATLASYTGKRELVARAMAKGRSRERAVEIATGIQRLSKAQRQPAIVIRPD